MSQSPDTPTGDRKREEHLSTDGKWRSFPRVPHLLQYVSNGNYYGRIKIKGKIIRESLETTVWSTARLKLADFLKQRLEARTDSATPPLFSEAVELFKAELAHDTSIKASSKKYRLWCLQKLLKSWPGLSELRLGEISEAACREWATKLHDEIASHYYNNTIATLRMAIEAGIKAHEANGGDELENPAEELKRTRVKQKELRLPESAHFKELVANLRRKSGGWGHRAADLIEFLAYSGMRIKSEALWVTWADIDWTHNEMIVRGNPETGTKNSEVRRVPILPDMRQLLERLQEDITTGGTERILKITRCFESLKRACGEMGLPHLTHHDFRHLFATRCIEAGVDIPTLSRWLGHKDGGALAMKTYGHLRRDHSQAMAEKVKF